MTTLLIALVPALGMAFVEGPASPPPSVVVVVGAPGQPEFASEFQNWSKHWKDAAAKGGADCLVIGAADEASKPDHDRLHEAIEARAGESAEPLWIVLIGHGTFDGREAKFNLRGPDVTATELAAWLAPAKRPIVLLDCSSASGPFLSKLSAPNRIVVTATRSGDEQNFARFGQFVSEAIADPAADLDKDGQVSVLEAFLTGSTRLAEFYKTKARLATEHPLLDDNGDRQGTPPDWFHGVRVTRRAKTGAAADGLRAHQIHLVPSDREKALPAAVRLQRDQLELQLAALRDRKEELGEDDYYKALEPLLLQLARLYKQAGLTESATPSR
ncbi:MAG: hypothetical protein U0794_21320 [Isosphaeraceae bacterium]